MSQEFKNRTFQFSLRIVRMIEQMPANTLGDVFGKQLLHCATSVGANYRAASRAKSSKDFLNKMKICEEEIDETLYWLELITHSSIFPEAKMAEILAEANELCAIITAICKTQAANLNIRKS